MLDLANAIAETFRPHVDSTFTLHAGDGATVELTLIRVVETSTQVPGRRRGFTLTFGGGGEPSRIFPQATYLLSHEALGEVELFIVPRALVGGVPRYDADFS